MADTGAKAEEMKGRAKEAAGVLSDDDDLRREGKTDQMSGKAKQKAEHLEDKIEEGIDRVKDKVTDS